MYFVFRRLCWWPTMPQSVASTQSNQSPQPLAAPSDCGPVCHSRRCTWSPTPTSRYVQTCHVCLSPGTYTPVMYVCLQVRTHLSCMSISKYVHTCHVCLSPGMYTPVMYVCLRVRKHLSCMSVSRYVHTCHVYTPVMYAYI